MNEVRRPITEKFLRNMRYYQSLYVVQAACCSGADSESVSWEVYSEHGELSREMRRRGYVVVSFDYYNGWDFDKAAHRRAFFNLLDEGCLI